MNLWSAKSLSLRSSRILPWLHFIGAILVFVLISLFTAAHSKLGNEISAGESAGFAWISANIIKLLWTGLSYLVFVFWIQYRQRRLTTPHFPRVFTVLIWIEILSITMIAVALFYAWHNFLPFVHTVLLSAILIQGLVSLNHNEFPGLEPCITLLQKPERNIGFFLVLLFFFGAVIVFVDPTWNLVPDRILLDTDYEYFLENILPPFLSGSTSSWFGIGMVAILIGSRALRSKLFLKPKFNRISLLFPFYILATFKQYTNFSTEAGIKYFILGAFSSGILLFGCSILYGFTGLTDFYSLELYFQNTVLSSEILNSILIGLLFILIGFLFKMAAAPFHM